VNGFVEECRREWSRLGVSDSVANEMAADLEADLAEAAAEGASPEDVLGTAAFDPRSFAVSWAAERGVIPAAAAAPRPSGRLPVAIAAFAAVAIVGLLLVLASPSGSVRVAVAPTAARVAIFPLPRPVRALPHFRVVAPRIAAVELGRARRRLWWIGLTALVVGAAGTIATSATWLRTR
jgi:hypothetical protein